MVQHRDRERTSTRRETETGRQRQLGKENQYREIDKREREKNSYLHRYKQVDGQRERERERETASQPDRRRNNCPKKIYFGRGSHGLVVTGGDSCPEGRWFESQHRILDGHFFTYICCKNCNVCLKKTKINEKEAGMAHFFKKNYFVLTVKGCKW